MKKLYILLTLVLALGACKALPEGYGIENPQQYSRVYLAAAYNGELYQDVESPEPVTIEIYANCSGVVPISSDITVTVGTDLSLVNEYNVANNKAYKAMPQECFSLQEDRSIIPSGHTTAASPATVNLITSAFNDESTYLLPVSITSVSDQSLRVNEALKTLYIAVRCKAGSITVTSGPHIDYSISDTENW